jgi:hypothetical protein
MVGAAFSTGMGAYGAFALVGGVLALMGAGQFALAKYLPKLSSGHHKAS